MGFAAYGQAGLLRRSYVFYSIIIDIIIKNYFALRTCGLQSFAGHDSQASVVERLVRLFFILILQTHVGAIPIGG